MQEQEPGRFDGAANGVPQQDDAARSAAYPTTGGEAVPAWYPAVEYGPQPYPRPMYPDQRYETVAAPQLPIASYPDHVVQQQIAGDKRRRRLSRRLRWGLTFGAGLLVGVIAAVVAGAASLATHLYVNSVTLPRDKVQRQVAQVLRDAYQVGSVKSVSCPSRIAGGKGSSFVCSYTVSGEPPGKVEVKILNTQGGLQVQPPSS